MLPFWSLLYRTVFLVQLPPASAAQQGLLTKGHCIREGGSRGRGMKPSLENKPPLPMSCRQFCPDCKWLWGSWWGLEYVSGEDEEKGFCLCSHGVIVSGGERPHSTVTLMSPTVSPINLLVPWEIFGRIVAQFISGVLGGGRAELSVPKGRNFSNNPLGRLELILLDEFQKACILQPLQVEFKI